MVNYRLRQFVYIYNTHNHKDLYNLCIQSQRVVIQISHKLYNTLYLYNKKLIHKTLNFINSISIMGSINRNFNYYDGFKVFCFFFFLLGYLFLYKYVCVYVCLHICDFSIEHNTHDESVCINLQHYYFSYITRTVMLFSFLQYRY